MRSSREEVPPPQAGSQSYRSASRTQRAGDVTSRPRRSFTQSHSGTLARQSLRAVAAPHYGLLSADRGHAAEAEGPRPAQHAG